MISDERICRSLANGRFGSRLSFICIFVWIQYTVFFDFLQVVSLESLAKFRRSGYNTADRIRLTGFSAV